MLLMKQGYKAGVKVLYADKLQQAMEFYQQASTQEYVYENYNISEEDALKIAILARKIMAKAEPDKPIPETEAISAAAEELQIALA